MAEMIKIGGRPIGRTHPTFVVAELSGNHRGSFARAEKIVRAAHAAGADAIKLQTYRAETITMRSPRAPFKVATENNWKGRTLFELYEEAHTPWNWHPRLFRLAARLGMQAFSSPFDSTAVDFLQTIKAPAYKVASFELVDLPLIRRIARTGKPMILSTGMATSAEIREALDAARKEGARQLGLLKCTSAYPSPEDEMNLRTIPAMIKAFRCPVGLSDHSLSTAIPAVAVALGARIVEKHLTLSRDEGGPDGSFSLEPSEFRTMVKNIRTTERALGKVRYGATAHEAPNRMFRRSLFVVRDMARGDLFTSVNVRSIRPGRGLHTRYLSQVLGRPARRGIRAGSPLSWSMVRR